MPQRSAPPINWVAIAIVMVIAAMLVTTTGSAQRAAAPATQGPGEPTRQNWLRRGISDIAWRPMAAAERAVFLTRWAEYDRLFATPDSLARPQGFTVAPSALAYSEGEPSTLFHFYYRYIFLQGVVTGGEGSALLIINENPVLTRSGTYAFAAPGTSGFEHVVADIPDYYRFTGSRTKLRAMLIKFQLTDSRHAVMDKAIEDSFRAFDWAAAARLLTR